LFQKSFDDDLIVRYLERDGHFFTRRQVGKIRRKMGCMRRLSVWRRAQSNAQLRDIVQKELDNGEIEGLGKRLLQEWFRKAGYITTR
jgi:hypothetical protein